MVIRKIPVYNFENLSFYKPQNGDFLKQSFYLSLPPLPEFEAEKTLFSLPGALELRVIIRSYKDGNDDNRSLDSEGCFYFNEKDERILEAVYTTESADGAARGTHTVRLPLSAPFARGGETGLYFDGTWLRFMRNGEVLNQNITLGFFSQPEGELYLDSSFSKVCVSAAENVTVSYREEKTIANTDFYFPHGWNTNIGDVMTFSHGGVYHLIYLLDRRHHGSGPCGSHYICQLTSENLTDWYEQKPIVEIDEPWKTCGTGTMLYHGGKYYMSYGLHTGRYPDARKKLTAEFNAEKSEFIPVTFEEIFAKGALPEGAALSESDDGISFTPKNVIFHAAQNPSAYTASDGKIKLYCGYGGEGVFEAENFNSRFRASNTKFDFVNNSVMRNTTECPAFFEWNGYRYLLIGFTGYFRTLSPDSSEFADAAAMGESIYDALSVPMVSAFKGNRRLIAGWVRSNLGWGGPLMQRELIQCPDGKLDMKWIPELIPETVGENLISDTELIGGFAALERKRSCYLKLKINPQNSEKIGISLKDGDSYTVLQIDRTDKTVQINDSLNGGFTEKIPTILEIMKSAPEDVKPYSKVNFTNIPSVAKNYTLGDIRDIDGTFELKLILRCSRRMHSTVIDAEIAGKRTMISVRTDFFPTELSVISDGNIEIAEKSLHYISFEE